MIEYLEAGKIVNTHGIKGELKIESWLDSAEFLGSFEYMYIDEKPFKLLSGRVHKHFLIAQLEGVADINAAMALKTKEVFVDKGKAKLPKGHFFIADIIGAVVVDESGSELGTLTEVLERPAANVYIVNGEREIMIPAVPEFILKTDVAEKKITVRLIEGM